MPKNKFKSGKLTKYESQELAAHGRWVWRLDFSWDKLHDLENKLIFLNIRIAL